MRPPFPFPSHLFFFLCVTDIRPSPVWEKKARSVGNIFSLFSPLTPPPPPPPPQSSHTVTDWKGAPFSLRTEEEDYEKEEKRLLQIVPPAPTSVLYYYTYQEGYFCQISLKSQKKSYLKPSQLIRYDLTNVAKIKNTFLVKLEPTYAFWSNLPFSLSLFPFSEGGEGRAVSISIVRPSYAACCHPPLLCSSSSSHIPKIGNWGDLSAKNQIA